MRCILWKADLFRLPVNAPLTTFSAGKHTKELGEELKGKRQILQLRAQRSKVHCIPSVAIDAAEELKGKLLQENSLIHNPTYFLWDNCT